MKELKLNPVDGPALSDKVYALALARIDAVMGCTENSPEEAELVLWAEIADAHERTSGTVTVATAGLAVHQPAGNKESPAPAEAGRARDAHARSLPAKWQTREDDGQNGRRFRQASGAGVT